MMEQPIKVTEWQQTYTYDSGIHSGVNTQVPSVSSKCIGDDEDLYAKQYTIKTTTYREAGGQGLGSAAGRGHRWPACKVGDEQTRHLNGGCAEIVVLHPSLSPPPSQNLPCPILNLPRSGCIFVNPLSSPRLGCHCSLKHHGRGR